MAASGRILFRRGRYAVARAKSHSNKNLLPRNPAFIPSDAESGLVVFTLANSALALAAITQLLPLYPNYDFLLMARCLAADDPSTHILRALERKYGDRVALRKCDFSKGLEQSTSAAEQLKADCDNGNWASVVAVICSVQYVNYTTYDINLPDHEDPSFETIFLAQFNFVIRIVELIDRENARVVVLNDRLYWRTPQSAFEKPSRAAQDLSYTFSTRQYDMKLSKAYLALILAFEEVRKLIQPLPKLRHLQIINLDLSSFHLLRPARTIRIQTVKRSFAPGHRNPLIRELGTAAKALATVALGEQFKGREGHFICTSRGLRRIDSSPASKDLDLQKDVFHRAMTFCGLSWLDYVNWAMGKRDSDSNSDSPQMRRSQSAPSLPAIGP